MKYLSLLLILFLIPIAQAQLDSNDQNYLRDIARQNNEDYKRYIDTQFQTLTTYCDNKVEDKFNVFVKGAGDLTGWFKWTIAKSVFSVFGILLFTLSLFHFFDMRRNERMFRIDADNFLKLRTKPFEERIKILELSNKQISKELVEYKKKEDKQLKQLQKNFPTNEKKGFFRK